MKKRILLIASVVLLLAVTLSLFVGCNDGNADKQIPVYKEMSISTTNEFSTASYDGDPSDASADGTPAAGEFVGDFAGRNETVDKKDPFKDNGTGETVEEELASSFTASETTDDICYAESNKDIYVHIVIENPDRFEIVSVTFDGKPYSSDQFEENSDFENIILKHAVGAKSGIVEYALGDIKYQDGDETKDVTVEGSKTATVGLKMAGQVSAAVSRVDINTNSVSFRAIVTDRDGLLAYSNGTLKAVIYDGADIVAEKALSLGMNDVVFSGLKTSTLYQYAIVGYYNDLSGNGTTVNVLAKNAFYTDAVVLFDDVAVWRDGISYGFLWHEAHQSATVTALKLYRGETLVETLDASEEAVEGLFSNTTYRLVAEYVNGDQTESIEIVFTTVANMTPTLSVVEPTKTKNSVGFTINVVDWDGVGEITEIELIHASGITYARNLSQRSFTDLLSNNLYTVKVTYTYDLNDGRGEQTLQSELSIVTDARSAPDVNIVEPTQTRTSVGFSISESDPENLGAVSKIELIHASGTVVAQNVNQLLFIDLLPGNAYTVRVTYTYNLRDGTNEHTIVREIVITTESDHVISDPQSTDLAGYCIVAGAELTEFGQSYVVEVARKMSSLTGTNIGVMWDSSGSTIRNQSLEILIGLTRREETLRLYNEIEGEGWGVRLLGNKIVVVGTTPYLTTVALNWLERTYLNAAHIEGTVLLMQQKNVVCDLSLLPLADGNKTFTVVYETGKDANDAPHQVATDVQADLAALTGLTVSFVSVDQSNAAMEILVGNMSRADVKAEIAKIEANECAIVTKNGKIYLVAWSDDSLPTAYELFEELLRACAVKGEGNSVTYRIPSDSVLVHKHDCDWITDFVKPEAEGLYPEAAVDVNNGSLQYIYAGSGATRETFLAYCETLIAAGFIPLENEDVQWEGSSFRTFIHREKGISLHVSHRAFTHAEEQDVEGLLNSIRIVSGSLNAGGMLVDKSYFNPQVEGVDYVKRTNSQITSNMIDAVSENWGLGQIITLADGSFIIIDGGRAKSSSDLQTLWDILREMHKRAHGAYPTARNPIHIRAWIISHEHGDHHNLVQQFIKKYGAETELKFDYMLANFGSATQLRTAGGTNTLRNNLKTYQETVVNGFEFIEVNSGQVFYFANCKLEILVTVDDMYPWRCSEQNNASLMVRTTLYESDGTNSCEVSSLWLGDCEVQQSAVARAMYGSFLASDQVQIAHHGNNGGSDKRIYALVGNCEVIWHPSKVSQNAIDRAGSDSWSCNFSAAFLNPNCKLLIFNGSDLSSCPEWSVTLTITATGPLYDQLYDAVSGEHIDAKGQLWPVVDVQAYRKKA